jgi:undecaprenyl diphosphate synthase
MQLLHLYVVGERKLPMDQNIRFCSIGRVDRLPEAVLAEMRHTREMTDANSGLRLCLALDYGARDEIVQAVRGIVFDVQAGRVDSAAISEHTIADYLYTAGMPDPDLMIRTAGEMRISNFLLWQLSYAELWVTDIFWPEFGIEHFRQALISFARRERRFGGLSPEKT